MILNAQVAMTLPWTRCPGFGTSFLAMPSFQLNMSKFRMLHPKEK
jgi:hypothetical protein